MATITERFGFTKPAGSDPASIVPLNSNTDLTELYLGRTQDMIAPMYDNTATYRVNDIVTYESKLYKCNTAITTPEDFDDIKWDETTAVQEGSGGGGGTEVIPNPQGTPTDTLSTIEIDGTIFDIEGGGSGGGEQFVWSYTRSITTTNYGWWVVEDEDGQSLDPDEYAIIDIFVTNQPYYSAVWAKTNSENVYRMSFVNINDWGSIRSSKTATIQVLYMKRDAITTGGGASTADDVTYDNTTSQLTATNVQDAIDEVVSDIGASDTAITALEGRVDSTQGAITDAYSDTATYAVGDYCIYNDTLYQCTTAVTSAESFNPSKWTATTIGDEISELNSSLISKSMIKKYTLNVTTTSTGAVQIPFSHKVIIDWYLTSQAGLVFRRDTNYFTCYNNELNAPITNTNVTIVIVYLDF